MLAIFSTIFGSRDFKYIAIFSLFGYWIWWHFIPNLTEHIREQGRKEVALETAQNYSQRVIINHQLFKTTIANYGLAKEVIKERYALFNQNKSVKNWDAHHMLNNAAIKLLQPTYQTDKSVHHTPIVSWFLGEFSKKAPSSQQIT